MSIYDDLIRFKLGLLERLKRTSTRPGRLRCEVNPALLGPQVVSTKDDPWGDGVEAWPRRTGMGS
jgi:hypothetical protein